MQEEVQSKRKAKQDKPKQVKVEDEDENLRKYKALNEMVKKMIESYEKNEKIDFVNVSEVSTRSRRTPRRSINCPRFPRSLMSSQQCPRSIKRSFCR
jgi:predicted butyrate kinase (DUF1464 family)